MATSIADAVKATAEAFVQAEVTRLLPHAAALVPGLPGALLSAALSEPLVQQGIADLEVKAVNWTVDETAKGLSALVQLVSTHVHGKLGAVLQAQLAKAPPDVPLSLQQATQLGAIAATGKLDAVFQQAMQDLGLSVPAAPAAPAAS